MIVIHQKSKLVWDDFSRLFQAGTLRTHTIVRCGSFCVQIPSTAIPPQREIISIPFTTDEHTVGPVSASNEASNKRTTTATVQSVVYK